MTDYPHIFSVGEDEKAGKERKPGEIRCPNCANKKEEKIKEIPEEERKIGLLLRKSFVCLACNTEF